MALQVKMNSEKKLKDPIYGYIAIPQDIIQNIIDTAPFQRLRRIIQTSYAPVFASAVHNRFVHSLGVYHLGRMAGEMLKKEINETLREEIKKKNTSIKQSEVQKIKLDNILNAFLLACLLHDVGHAPFSHTGEGFYATPAESRSLKKKIKTKEDVSKFINLHNALKKSVGNEETFCNDIPKNDSEAAAPHEIVSAIVGIKEFGVKEFINKVNKKPNPFYELFQKEREFFARCITGYLYSELTLENSIRNCFIQMLNSKLIDVDKLDYLIRDAYLTGYENTNIDYPRLLGALTVTYEDSRFAIAYHKGAVSVIENVVYAHDSERKWIQTHPVILYENYLLSHIFKDLTIKYDKIKNKLFSIEALSKEGVNLKHGLTVRLLCDEDIIHLMKSQYDNKPLVTEYFQRSERLHPVWKSEAEYRYYFEKRIGVGGELFTKFQEALNKMVDYLETQTDNSIIDGERIKILQNELNDVKSSNLLTPEKRKIVIEEKQKLLAIAKCLLGSNAIKKANRCVLLKAYQFKSNFRNFTAVNTPFEIRVILDKNTHNKSVSFNDLVVSLDSRNKPNTDLFYLFSKERRAAVDISNAFIRLFPKLLLGT